MDDDLLASQTRAVLGAYARGMGVEATAFEGGLLTIAERPGNAPWPYLAFAVSSPGGTVLSLDPRLLDFAARAQPRQPFVAAKAEFIRQLAATAERLGPRVTVDGPNICWALGQAPERPNLPAGLQYEERDAAWMNAQLAGGRFPNGAGSGAVNARAFRNRYAVVITDRAGEPVAVGGVFDSFGLAEVGVDVVPERQGEGLGAAVVAAAVRRILERGETPLYGCAADNIRSQRTARAAGFVPVFSDTVIDAVQ